jgi:VanZ family protein
MLRFAALVALAVIYGSLYPFDFHAGGGLAAALTQLLAAWPQRVSRADLIANVLLYAPLGFALAAAQAPRWGRPAALAAAVGLGAALSLAVELAQHFLPARSVSLIDVVCDTAGATAGGLCGTLTSGGGARARLRGLRTADPMALLLAATWIADRLWPFVPTLDISQIKSALKPLVLYPRLVPADVLRHGTCWLAFAVLLQASFPGRASRTALVAIMLAGPFAAVAIVGRTVSASAVLGAALACAAWLVLASRPEKAVARTLALLMAATILSVGLAPYTFMETQRPFGWVPFRGFIDGSMLAATSAFLTKVFLFGVAVWSAARAGLGLAAAGGLVGALLLAVGWAQTYLPGRSAGATDAAIALALTFAIRWLRSPAAAAWPVERGRREALPEAGTRRAVYRKLG